jgi:nucleoside-specific outer membrane channel protein Tsx
MIFWEPTNEYVAENIPEAFKMPFNVYGKYEEEIYRWKYFRLRPKPYHPIKRASNPMVNGGLERRG